jgi:predicted nucleotidyltransferase
MAGHDEEDALLDAVAKALSPIDGVGAIVLGGSRGSRRGRPDSDYDIGLYYRGARPFDPPEKGRSVAAFKTLEDLTNMVRGDRHLISLYRSEDRPGASAPGRWPGTLSLSTNGNSLRDGPGAHLRSPGSAFKVRND